MTCGLTVTMKKRLNDPYYTASDFQDWEIYNQFKSAARRYGWKSECQGVWRGDIPGLDGLTIERWVALQGLITTLDIVNATGFSRSHISKVAIDNGIAPESAIMKPGSMHRWTIETSGKLLEALGKLTRCHKCNGIAGINKQGESTCLECE